MLEFSVTVKVNARHLLCDLFISVRCKICYNKIYMTALFVFISNILRGHIITSLELLGTKNISSINV